MVYTLLFFIFVTTILMNIIFGVIIDTFAELRAKKDAVDRFLHMMNYTFEISTVAGFTQSSRP